ncbi:hypothetical protein EFP44_05830 [Lacticaseibacillus paracasei]|nr:hypothetical protein [Lacticaseibacillus paracasei]
MTIFLAIQLHEKFCIFGISIVRALATWRLVIVKVFF